MGICISLHQDETHYKEILPVTFRVLLYPPRNLNCFLGIEFLDSDIVKGFKSVLRVYVTVLARRKSKTFYHLTGQTGQMGVCLNRESHRICC